MYAAIFAILFLILFIFVQKKNQDKKSKTEFTFREETGENNIVPPSLSIKEEKAKQGIDVVPSFQSIKEENAKQGDVVVVPSLSTNEENAKQGDDVEASSPSIKEENAKQGDVVVVPSIKQTIETTDSNTSSSKDTPSAKRLNIISYLVDIIHHLENQESRFKTLSPELTSYHYNFIACLLPFAMSTDSEPLSIKNIRSQFFNVKKTHIPLENTEDNVARNNKINEWITKYQKEVLDKFNTLFTGDTTNVEKLRKQAANRSKMCSVNTSVDCKNLFENGLSQETHKTFFSITESQNDENKKPTETNDLLKNVLNTYMSDKSTDKLGKVALGKLANIIHILRTTDGKIDYENIYGTHFDKTIGTQQGGTENKHDSPNEEQRRIQDVMKHILKKCDGSMYGTTTKCIPDLSEFVIDLNYVLRDKKNIIEGLNVLLNDDAKRNAKYKANLRYLLYKLKEGELNDYDKKPMYLKEIESDGDLKEEFLDARLIEDVKAIYKNNANTEKIINDFFENIEPENCKNRSRIGRNPCKKNNTYQQIIGIFSTLYLPNDKLFEILQKIKETRNQTIKERLTPSIAKAKAKAEAAKKAEATKKAEAEAAKKAEATKKAEAEAANTGHEQAIQPAEAKAEEEAEAAQEAEAKAANTGHEQAIQQAEAKATMPNKIVQKYIETTRNKNKVVQRIRNKLEEVKTDINSHPISKAKVAAEISVTEAETIINKISNNKSKEQSKPIDDLLREAETAAMAAMAMLIRELVKMSEEKVNNELDQKRFDSIYKDNNDLIDTAFQKNDPIECIFKDKRWENPCKSGMKREFNKDIQSVIKLFEKFNLTDEQLFEKLQYKQDFGKADHQFVKFVNKHTGLRTSNKFSPFSVFGTVYDDIQTDAKNKLPSRQISTTDVNQRYNSQNTKFYVDTNVYFEKQIEGYFKILTNNNVTLKETDVTSKNNEDHLYQFAMQVCSDIYCIHSHIVENQICGTQRGIKNRDKLKVNNNVSKENLKKITIINENNLINDDDNLVLDVDKIKHYVYTKYTEQIIDTNQLTEERETIIDLFKKLTTDKTSHLVQAISAISVVNNTSTFDSTELLNNLKELTVYYANLLILKYKSPKDNTMNFNKTIHATFEAIRNSADMINHMNTNKETINDLISKMSVGSSENSQSGGSISIKPNTAVGKLPKYLYVKYILSKLNLHSIIYLTKVSKMLFYRYIIQNFGTINYTDIALDTFYNTIMFYVLFVFKNSDEILVSYLLDTVLVTLTLLLYLKYIDTKNHQAKMEAFTENKEAKEELTKKHTNNELLNVKEIKPRMPEMYYVDKRIVHGICLTPFYALMMDV